MESLSSLTDELRRKIDLDVAMSMLSTSFDANKPRRFIEGIAVSSRDKNANGDGFVALGINVTIPIPLLLSHQWLEPIGRVIAIEAREDQVFFKAEISNSGRSLGLDIAWMQMVCQFVTDISIGPRNLPNYPQHDHTLYNWSIDEISLVDQGADPNARVSRVWEIAPVIYLDGRPSTTVFWNAP